MPSTWRTLALQALSEPDPATKAAAARALGEPATRAALPCGADEPPAVPSRPLPGRPDRPALVAPAALKPRPVHTTEGRAALLHALAHIEFNAINLALDAVWRFGGLPEAYYSDWIGVAAEEALHFELLRAHLQGLGFDYGDFPAHDGLWDMAERTRDDLLARLALVPRTLEARGLDAAPPIRDKLAAAGDAAGAAILQRILDDEVGHVAIGIRWFEWACAQRGLAPEATAEALALTHRAPRLRGPFNLDARRKAGFSELELQRLSTPQ
jgi:uncharacterized ferritin-like protein (DUF455 family)